AAGAGRGGAAGGCDRAAGRVAPDRRRGHTASDRVWGQRWAGLERGARDGVRRGADGRKLRAAGRGGGTSGGGVLDGVRRVRLDAGAEGAVRAADRARARRAGAESGRRAEGAGADLPRGGALAGTGGSRGRESDGGPGYRAGGTRGGGMG